MLMFMLMLMSGNFHTDISTAMPMFMFMLMSLVRQEPGFSEKLGFNLRH